MIFFNKVKKWKKFHSTVFRLGREGGDSRQGVLVRRRFQGGPSSLRYHDLIVVYHNIRLSKNTILARLAHF